MNKQIITILGIMLMLTLVSAATYGSVEQDIEIKTDTVTPDNSGGSSSGGGPAPSDWSAKCGYNKECLYGTSNETIENKIEVIQEEVIEDIPEPIVQEDDEETPIVAAILVTLFIIGGISLVSFLLWKIFKKDEVYDNYQKEVENE